MRKAPEDEYPLGEVSLGLLLHVKTLTPMPQAAMARLALRELRRMTGEIEVRHLKATSKPTDSTAKDDATPIANGAHRKSPRGNAVDLAGLDKRIVKTAYRILD